MAKGRWTMSSAIAALVVVVPVALWVHATGNPAYYVWHSTPPGQVCYVLSKLVALVALSLFWFQAMTGLTRNNPWLSGLFRVPMPAHRKLGLLLFGLVCLHASLFVAAVSIRSGHFAYELLVPSFGSGFYDFYVSLGVVALGLFPLGILAGVMRRRGELWSWLHRIWLVVFALVFLHGVSIGTETRLGLMLYVYYFIAASLAAAVVMRIAGELRESRRAERGSTDPAARESPPRGWAGGSSS